MTDTNIELYNPISKMSGVPLLIYYTDSRLFYRREMFSCGDTWKPTSYPYVTGFFSRGALDALCGAYHLRRVERPTDQMLEFAKSAELISLARLKSQGRI